jgi:glycosyltransferase involved in cell wall biosynthesis
VPTKPRLLCLNQYYWPAVEADGRLLTELCEGLADEWDVSVLTGTLPGAGPGSAERNRVRIVRVPSTVFDRRRLSLRALNYGSYFVSAVGRGVVLARPDVVLCFTNPFFVGDAGYALARRFGAALVVVVQDVFPDTAVALGELRNGPIVDLLDRLVRFYLCRADRVVAVGDTMRTRLEGKGVPAARLRVIENWTDTDAIRPQPRDNPWAREHGLDGRFVVMHSGNVGHAQDLDTLVEAAALLRGLDRLSVVVVGSGVRLAELRALGEVRGAPVSFLPFQPDERVAQALSSADVHVVGLAGGLAGCVVPSRIYGVLAAGRPVIAAAEAESETARLVVEAGCGLVVEPGRPPELAAAIRRAYDGELGLDALGRRGREHAVAHADRAIALARYRELLQEARALRSPA